MTPEQWPSNLPQYDAEYARQLFIALRSVGCLILEEFSNADGLQLETHLREHLKWRNK